MNYAKFSVEIGQLKLRSSSVLIVGAGGLGCPAAQYLAGAGVGTLGLVDGDVVEHSNLHRQVLHRTKNVGKFKVDSAIESLKEYVSLAALLAHCLFFRILISALLRLGSIHIRSI